MSERAELAQSIAVDVYKLRLVADSGDGAVERMIEKDGDGGEKLANRAKAYVPMVSAVLKVLETRGAFTPPVRGGE